MQIAIVGAGRMGSMFAFHLARAKHDVTVIARGARLQQLERDQAIATVAGERAPVKVADRLDAETPFDAALVTVFATQVEPLLPSLRASRAKTVVFLFNTFDSLAGLRDAVGAERFAFGFPMLPSALDGGQLRSTKLSRASGHMTSVSDPTLARVLDEAGIPAEHEPDMESYLRAHAAFVVPMMAMAARVAGREGAGLSWAEAKEHALAMDEGFRITRKLGNRIIPGAVAALSRLPTSVVTGLLWAMSCQQATRDLAQLGPDEARYLIDAMHAAAPDDSRHLVAVRP